MLIDLRDHLNNGFIPRSLSINTLEDGNIIKITIRLNDDGKVRIPPGRPRKDDSLAARVLQALKENGEMAAKDLIQLLDSESSQISTALSKLHDESKVIHVSHGRWDASDRA